MLDLLIKLTDSTIGSNGLSELEIEFETPKMSIKILVILFTTSETVLKKFSICVNKSLPVIFINILFKAFGITNNNLINEPRTLTNEIIIGFKDFNKSGKPSINDIIVSPNELKAPSSPINILFSSTKISATIDTTSIAIPAITPASLTTT